MPIITDVNDLLRSKLEWCYGLALWDKYFEQFVFAEGSANDPDEFEEDYDDEGNQIVERMAFNAWCAGVSHFDFDDNDNTVLCLDRGMDSGGLACPRVDMPMNEFISLLCAMCGEDFERDLTEDECRERFVLVKYLGTNN